ncbi:MAG: MaoC family dehydratase N-terminal domain-containing protein [Rhodospirillales bacterium]|nr:MaoC family dehydratase N-terminal domain-containing protein [Rhodospirillales bacterium]
MLPNKDEIARRPEQVSVIGEITALMFQRYAIAVGDLNPIYFDDAAARAAGYPGIVAPPNYLTSVLGWQAGPAEAALLADGTEPGIMTPEIRGLRLMGGGHDLTFGRPVRPGDVVTARRRLVDLYEREAKFGVLIFAISDIVYTDQRGEHLVSCRETIIAARSSK